VSGLRVSLALRLTTLMIVVVALTVLVAYALAETMGAGPAAAAAALVVGVVVALVLARALLGRVRETAQALSDGLMSFAERDYTFRLAVTRKDEVGGLVQRFNQLGDKLRAEHNDGYQTQLLMETVVEAAPIALVLCTEANRVEFANGIARQLLSGGASIDGRDFGEVLSAAAPGLRAAVEGPSDTICAIQTAAGEESLHVSRRYFQISTQQHTLHLLKPLTREMARQEAEVWKKAIRVISHELNNSLAPIQSLVHSARLIQANPEHTHKLAGVFDVIEERAGHLFRFLDGYARLAKLPPPRARAVPWRGFLDEVRALYPFALDGELPAEPGWFDPEQLSQVVINLLKNGVESGSPKAELKVAITKEDGGIELAVLDRGKGMDAEALVNSLLPFYSTKKTGSGLGLTLCREIVDAHGGRLSIAARDGGGLVVTCWLPGPGLDAAAGMG
jgi:two-component system, NtrC family, nitrogen regulation sensor histidine kinase NtrY